LEGIPPRRPFPVHPTRDAIISCLCFFIFSPVPNFPPLTHYFGHFFFSAFRCPLLSRPCVSVKCFDRKFTVMKDRSARSPNFTTLLDWFSSPKRGIISLPAVSSYCPCFFPLCLGTLRKTTVRSFFQPWRGFFLCPFVFSGGGWRVILHSGESTFFLRNGAPSIADLC